MKSFSESFTLTKACSDRFNPFKQLSETRNSILNNSNKVNLLDSTVHHRLYNKNFRNSSVSNLKSVGELVTSGLNNSKGNPYLTSLKSKKQDRWNVYEKIATRIKFQKKFNNLNS